MTECRTAYPTYGHSRPKIYCTSCGTLCCNGCLYSGSNQCIPCRKDTEEKARAIGKRLARAVPHGIKDEVRDALTTAELVA